MSINLILGLTASACFILGNFILHRTWMLTALAMGMTTVSVQYALGGQWSVAAVNAILLALVIVTAVRTWSPQALTRLGVAAGAILAFTVVATGQIPTSVQSALPLLAATLNILAFTSSSLVRLKIFLALGTFTWLVFDLSWGNWQNGIGDFVGFTMAITAIIRLRVRASKPTAGPRGRTRQGRSNQLV